MILDNVAKKGSIISANYCYAENMDDIGRVSYDIDKDALVDIHFNARDEEKDIKYPFYMIKYAFRHMVEYNSFPKTYHYIWY